MGSTLCNRMKAVRTARRASSHCMRNAGASGHAHNPRLHCEPSVQLVAPPNLALVPVLEHSIDVITVSVGRSFFRTSRSIPLECVCASSERYGCGDAENSEMHSIRLGVLVLRPSPGARACKPCSCSGPRPCWLRLEERLFTRRSHA